MNARVPDDELPDDLADRAAERLLAVHGAARTAVLAELIAAHPDRATALRALCNQLAGVEQLLDAGFPDPATTFPEQIGGHRVLRRLGEGAFGIVYLCRQQRPVVREVAIKVLRPGAGDPKTLQRFAAERQLLAQLNHPGITQVFDAGELPDGRPFFVMEYVDGTPIHEWCRHRTLPCAARLRLFVDVCRAVAHAHARGIVHRDLKPANVLVVDTPEGPAPKVIDFGIAKAVGGGAGDIVEPRTEAGRVIGTPGYMSPEQAAGRIDEVDERADVFSLGVMLYELLTDRMPWPRTATANDTAPLLPSQRVTTIVDHPPPSSPQPRHKLAVELRGDLDWITLKALARDRNERYARVVDLAADVERHLHGRTVSVGPPSLGYRLRKATHQHRVQVRWAAAFLVVVIVSTGLLWQLRDRANHDATLRSSAITLAVTKFRERAVDAAAKGAPAAVIRGLVDDALALRNLQPEDEGLGTPDQRLARLELLVDLADTCHLLGAYREAVQFASEARTLGAALATTSDAPRSARLHALAARELGRSNFQIGDFEAARAATRDAVAELSRLHAENPGDHAVLLANALVERASACGRVGDIEGQLVAHTRALETLQAFHETHPDDAEAQRNLVRFHCGLANIRLARKQVDAAGAALQRAEQLVAELPLVTDEERALVQFRLAKFHVARGDPTRALPAARLAIRYASDLLVANPDRYLQRQNLLFLRRLVFEQQWSLGDRAAARAEADALLAMPEGDTNDARTGFADALVRVARLEIAAIDRMAFERADLLLAKACTVLRAPSTDARTTEVRASAFGLHGHVRAELHDPWPASRWDELAKEAETAELAEWHRHARLQASMRRAADGDLDGARADLAAAVDGAQESEAADLARQAVTIALIAADPNVALTGVDELLAASPPPGHRLAAAVAAWRAAEMLRRAGGTDRANAARTLATQACDHVLSTTTTVDPVTTSAARVCRALVDDPSPANLATIAAELPQLDAARTTTPASLWPEALVCAAHVVLRRDELTASRAAEALEALEHLAAMPRRAVDDVELAARLAALRPSDAWATTRCTDLAFTVLQHAVAAGLRGRERLRNHAAFAPWRDDPRFTALVLRVPE